MDLKTVCVLFLAVAVITAEARNLDPNTDTESLSHQRSKRQFGYGGGFPGSIGVSSAQASAGSSSLGFPGFGGGFSSSNAFAGANSYSGKK